MTVDRPKDLQEMKVCILEHLPAIVTLCNRMFRQRSDADDAVQQSVIEILNSWSTYSGKAAIEHWMTKIAWNTSLRLRQKCTANVSIESVAMQMQNTDSNPVDKVMQQEQEELLRVTIAELPDDLQGPLVMYYYHSMTQSQIAKLMECSQKTISEKIERARSMLTVKLAPVMMAGMVPIETILNQGGYDMVTAPMVESVKQTIAGHVMASHGTVVAAIGKTIVTTGGVVMNVKLIAAAITIAVISFWGGKSLTVKSDPSSVNPYEETMKDLQRQLTQAQAGKGESSNAERMQELEQQLAMVVEQMQQTQQDLANQESLNKELSNLVASLQDPTVDEAATKGLATKELKFSPMISMMMKMRTIMQPMEKKHIKEEVDGLKDMLSLTDTQAQLLEDALFEKGDALFDALENDDRIRNLLGGGQFDEDILDELLQWETQTKNEFEDSLVSILSPQQHKMYIDNKEQQKRELLETSIEDSIEDLAALEMDDYQQQQMSTFLRSYSSSADGDTGDSVKWREMFSQTNSISTGFTDEMKKKYLAIQEDARNYLSVRQMETLKETHDSDIKSMEDTLKMGMMFFQDPAEDDKNSE